MLNKSLDDTIIAVSTPPGSGGLGIVRLSGPEALAIGRRIFKPRKDKAQILPRKIILGDLVGAEGTRFDEAFFLYFKAPLSYTREDLVEISCHGSPAILEEVVRLGVKAGARRANPGEYTLRAFLRGRIDIVQAEAVQALVSATSLRQARISYGQLEGGLSSRIHIFREKIIALLADIEVRLEFSDEKLGISNRQIVASLQDALRFVCDLIASFETGRLLAEGLTLAIVGKPNVGKSTLFNSLVGKDRAIVTPFPGTTRDYLHEKIRIGDGLFNLIDMAGLGKTNHPIEKEGIRKGEDLARRADGILFLLDSSKKESRQDLDLIRDHRKSKAIIVFNKIDLFQKINKGKVMAAAGKTPNVEISALKGSNIAELRKKIRSVFTPSSKKWDEIILHSRQKDILERIKDSLDAGLRVTREGYGEEICAEEIRKTVFLLGQLTGEIRTEEVLLNIFNRFCIGK